MAQNTPILGKIKSSESAASLDAKYGPYASKAAANAALGENGDDVITAGLTVGVTQSDGSVKEFWYQPDGQGGLQLVEKQTASVEVDSELSSTSENPVQNKVLKSALDAKGTYSKPSGGIPKTDLASDVQTSLGKADTALQQHQDISGKADKVANAQENNFASFDSNGGIKDSTYKAADFALIAQAVPTPQSGDEGKILGYEAPTEGANPIVGWVFKPQNGKSALQIYNETYGTNLNEVQFIDVLKQNYPMEYVAYDATAAAQTIGTGFASIGTLAADSTTAGKMYLMPNDGTTPTGTILFVTVQTGIDQNDEPIYAWYKLGDLNVPSNVLTEDDVVDDFTTGGINKPASAETVKTIAETTMELIHGENLLNPSEIDTEHRLNTAGGLKEKGTYAQVYGVTDYIEIGEGVICNHSVPASGSSVVGVAVYDNNKLFIGHRSCVNLGDSISITKSTDLNGTPAEGSDSTNPTYVRFSLYNPTYVEGGVAYDGVTDGYAVYKGTTLPQSFVPYVTPHWEQKKQVIEDGEITTDKLANTSVTTAKIADGAITLDKMADTVEEFMSKNLCNPEECVIGNGKAISINTGGLVNSSQFNGQTGFIPIDERGLYCPNTADSGASSGNMLYDVNKQPLQAVLGQSYLRGKYLKYVEGAVYAKFSILPVENASDIMVNRGNAAIDYEPYLGKKKMLSPNILPTNSDGDVATYLDGVEVQLPNEIVVTKGDNLQVFYRSCVKCRNIDAFDITSYCKKGSVYYGMPHPRYFQLDTSSSSIAANNSYTLTITVSDNAHRVVASGSTTIRVINAMTSPSSTKNILMLGASTLTDGRITREVYRRLCTNSGAGTPFEPTGINLSNIAFVGSGSTGSTYPNVYQEAHSGKGWNWYADQGSDTNIYRFFCPSSVDLSNASEGDIYKQGNLTFELTNDISTQNNVFTAIVTGTGTVVATNGTLTKESGRGPDTIAYDTASAEGGNPFWYGNKLDFQHYANDAANHCNGNIDLIVACLGGNDIAQVAEGFEYCKETYIKPFLDAFHSDFPNGKVMIYTPPLMRYNGCATKPSANYWPRVVQFWAYAKGYEDLLTEEYAEGHTYSEFVSVTATTYEFDNVNLFGGSDIPVCNRSEVTEKFSTDNLHYGLAGCNTVADTLYHCINDVL